MLLFSSAWAAAQGTQTANADRDGDRAPFRHIRLSTKPLDFSHAPTTDELIAAGQLGGHLTPTHQVTDRKKDEAARWDFGRAIEKWNWHEYPEAVQLLRKHLKDFPDSPWAAEAALHIGCDATYNGRYTEAESLFRQLIV